MNRWILSVALLITVNYSSLLEASLYEREEVVSLTQTLYCSKIEREDIYILAWK